LGFDITVEMIEMKHLELFYCVYFIRS